MEVISYLSLRLIAFLNGRLNEGEFSSRLMTRSTPLAGISSLSFNKEGDLAITDFGLVGLCLGKMSEAYTFKPVPSRAKASSAAYLGSNLWATVDRKRLQIGPLIGADTQTMGRPTEWVPQFMAGNANCVIVGDGIRGVDIIYRAGKRWTALRSHPYRFVDAGDVNAQGLVAVATIERISFLMGTPQGLRASGIKSLALKCPVDDLRLSPDSKWLAYAENDYHKHPKVTLIDLKTRRRVEIHIRNGDPIMAAKTRDGRIVAVVTQRLKPDEEAFENRVVVFSPKGIQISKFPLEARPETATYDWARDRVAIGLSSGRIAILDLNVQSR